MDARKLIIASLLLFASLACWACMRRSDMERHKKMLGNQRDWSLGHISPGLSDWESVSAPRGKYAPGVCDFNLDIHAGCTSCRLVAW